MGRTYQDLVPPQLRMLLPLVVYSPSADLLIHMHSAVVKIVALLLLIVQGGVALIPGRTICIPVQRCGTHVQEAPAACDHCESECDSENAESWTGPPLIHVSCGLDSHLTNQCGCHVHLPVPSNEQAPSAPRNGAPELKALTVAQVVELVMRWESQPPRADTHQLHQSDFSISDQVRSLKTTRLLI